MIAKTASAGFVPIVLLTGVTNKLLANKNYPTHRVLMRRVGKLWQDNSKVRSRFS